MEARKVTFHSGRQGKNGVYTAKHNDRDYEHSHDDSMNIYWHKKQFEGEDVSSLTFDEYEQFVYEKRIGSRLKQTNDNYVKNRHPERVKTIDDIRHTPKTAPAETLIYFGNRLNEPVGKDLMFHIYQEYYQWHCKTYPDIDILDVAFHFDEKGAPHIHERKQGFVDGRVSMDGALEKAGVDLPDPTQPKSRYNCRVMTYTEQCKQRLYDIALSYGLEMSLNDDLGGHRGSIDREQYVRQEMQNIMQDESMLDEYKRDLEDRAKDIIKMQENMDAIEKHYKELQAKNRELLEDNKRLEDQNFQYAEENRRLGQDYVALSSALKDAKAKKELQDRHDDVVTKALNRLQRASGHSQGRGIGYSDDLHL